MKLSKSLVVFFLALLVLAFAGPFAQAGPLRDRIAAKWEARHNKSCGQCGTGTVTVTSAPQSPPVIQASNPPIIVNGPSVIQASGGTCPGGSCSAGKPEVIRGGFFWRK